MRQLTTTQENLQTKEQSINQLEARYLELETQLAELQTESNAKDDNIQYLQNEKIVLEVALQAARADKSQLEEGAEKLGEDVLVASDILDELRQDIQVKASQVLHSFIVTSFQPIIAQAQSYLINNIFFVDWNSTTGQWLLEETSSETKRTVPTTKGKLFHLEIIIIKVWVMFWLKMMYCYCGSLYN